MQAIEAPPSESSFPWQTYSEQSLVQNQSNRPILEARRVNELAERVDNIGKRLKRVETLDTINESGVGDNVLPPVHDLLERLRYTRGCIQDQVAVAAGVFTEQSRSHKALSEREDPDAALRLELENWRRLDQQIQQDTIHNRSNRPGLRTSSSSDASTTGTPAATRSSSWASTSATVETTPGSDTPARSGSSGRHSRNGSLPALPRPAPEFLERRIPVDM
jgi:hypothetical protein